MPFVFGVEVYRNSTSDSVAGKSAGKDTATLALLSDIRSCRLSARLTGWKNRITLANSVMKHISGNTELK
jgi:hypothetical protein